METKTLLLNSWGMPHAVLSWQDAITLLFQTDSKGRPKAIVLEEYDETVCSPSTTLFVPAVMQLKNAVGQFKRNVKFSKINVFTRDKWTCQYCGGKFTMKELTYEHVRTHGRTGRAGRCLQNNEHGQTCRGFSASACCDGISDYCSSEPLDAVPSGRDRRGHERAEATVKPESERGHLPFQA